MEGSSWVSRLAGSWAEIEGATKDIRMVSTKANAVGGSRADGCKDLTEDPLSQTKGRPPITPGATAPFSIRRRI
jgi:hypothetical protein